MKQILPDVYQLRLPLPDATVDHVNVYVVRMAHGCLLVDTGLDSASCFESLAGQLDEIGFAASDIRRIIGTHLHPDHYGMAGRLREISGAEIALHAREVELIPAYTDFKNLIRKQLAWLHRNGVPGRVLELIKQVRTASPEIIKSMSPAAPDVTLEDGAVIAAGKLTFRVILAPGHSPGHICLYEPRLKLLIAGDHILADAQTYVNFDVTSTADPLREYLTSVAEMSHLEVDLALPGHGRSFTDLGPRIAETVRGIERHRAEVLTALGDAPKTAYLVAAETSRTGSGDATGLSQLPPMLHVVSVLQTLAHLESLCYRGQVTKLESDGVVRYRAPARQT